MEVWRSRPPRTASAAAAGLHPSHLAALGCYSGQRLHHRLGSCMMSREQAQTSPVDFTSLYARGLRVPMLDLVLCIGLPDPVRAWSTALTIAEFLKQERLRSAQDSCHGRILEVLSTFASVSTCSTGYFMASFLTLRVATFRAVTGLVSANLQRRCRPACDAPGTFEEKSLSSEAEGSTFKTDLAPQSL